MGSPFHINPGRFVRFIRFEEVEKRIYLESERDSRSFGAHLYQLLEVELGMVGEVLEVFQLFLHRLPKTILSVAIRYWTSRELCG